MLALNTMVYQPIAVVNGADKNNRKKKRVRTVGELRFSTKTSCGPSLDVLFQFVRYIFFFFFLCDFSKQNYSYLKKKMVNSLILYQNLNAKDGIKNKEKGIKFKYWWFRVF